MRVTHALEDDLINDYLEWAKTTIMNAVFEVYEDNLDIDKLEQDTTFQIGCIQLATYYYENRLTISEVEQHDNPYSVLHAIQTLRGLRHHFIKVDKDEN